MSNFEDLDSVISNVRLKLLDPLGRAIEGLKYQVKQGSRIVAQGVTDAHGQVQQFTSEIGKPLSVQVEHFLTGGMQHIRELTPWNPKFSVKLVSGKVKEKTTLVADQGSAGSYRRKTHVVKAGDTLGVIARANGTTAKEIADLNGINVSTVIYPGQVLKLPAMKGDGESGSKGNSGTGSKPATPQHTSTQTQLPVSTKPVGEVTPPPSRPAKTEAVDVRGENGTPKTVAVLTCQSACIKVGDAGPLIEELNIRLAGFGGTVLSPKPLNEFTVQTERAVKQFQRDYMGVPETGKVCGGLLSALDEFRNKYPVDLSVMRCPCGKCAGFGSGSVDSAKAGIFVDAKKNTGVKGIEHPGMHRALLWTMRAALFYIAEKEKKLGYSFHKVSSGYRCWYNNARHKRKTTNHMGNALDLQFRRGNATTRCSGVDIDLLRRKVFVSVMGAQMGWPSDNKLSLETAGQGATSWVHVDVRSFQSEYKDPRYYAINQSSADGDPLVTIAQREGRLALVACGGLPAPAPPTGTSAASKTGRVPVDTLTMSQAGIEFLKGWEQCSLQPYDDSEGFCTVGWGHLIERESCGVLQEAETFQEFKSGIEQATADKLLVEDVRRRELVVKRHVQVPLLQHEYDALVSLIFNMGSFKKCPKLLSKLNTADYSGCCDEFADITNGGVGGLVKRRKAEMNMFRNNVYDSKH